MLSAENGPDPSRLVLPPVPEDQASHPVAAWSEPLTIDSYLPAEPDDYPAFLDTRVYQGSSGRVYPLPFHERIEQTKAPHEWQAMHLENRWVRLVILPELGGRIHIGYDKVADYDFFYRNNVIKPALVGLAGPWIAGGVEFNWPQHHRPATFLPVDVEIEHEDDGSVTVWCSDHDPMHRMKGMHGIRLRPDSSVIEARVRLYNRTETTQTFLWWANVAAAVNDDYQSFFPTDVHFVADHAKRAVATFPRVDGEYYGIDYPARATAETPDGDGLDWYRNIPVPTSYMVTGTDDDFFGGYDHGRDAGFVHVADHTIAPGKKQWTWGDSPFGWAWGANLTDTDGPYVELMAGAFTDNQPDFSFILPGETTAFSQYWYPIRGIGPAHQANLDAAVRLDADPIDGSTEVRIAVAVTKAFPDATVTVTDATGAAILDGEANLHPDEPFVQNLLVPGTIDPSELTLTVWHGDEEVISWRPRAGSSADAEPPASATEPPTPAEIAGQDELFLTGQYLEQYHHATRSPEPYWREALRRDPGDSRSNVALGARLHAAARFDEAEEHFRAAIARVTSRVPNPSDGEAHYRLGITLAQQGRDAEALTYLRKSTWNSAWRVPGGYAVARLLTRGRDFGAAESALREVLSLDSNHSQASDLLVLVLRALGRDRAAAAVLAEQLGRDRLDQWARDLAGHTTSADAPTLLDVALEYAGAGFADDALRLLELAQVAAASTALGQVQVAPLIHYHRAAILTGTGDADGAARARSEARASSIRHCLASRLDDIVALETALSAGSDATASALLGSWYYDKGDAGAATAHWRRALGAHPDPATAALVNRNLGIAAYNVDHDAPAAAAYFSAARTLRPDDAKLLHEEDQLAARAGVDSAERLRRLEEQPRLVAARDDLSVTLAELLTRTGRAAEARELLLSRRFQPWEGGEGTVLAAWDAAMIALSEQAMGNGQSKSAADHLRHALRPPATLGEARHPLANTARLHFLLGEADHALGRDDDAVTAWTVAARSTGDFTEMSTQRFGAQTLYSVQALRRLGDAVSADALLAEIRAFTDELAATPATVDYFATSLPSMLLFHDDPQSARDRQVAELRARLAGLTTGPDALVSPAAGSR